MNENNDLIHVVKKLRETKKYKWLCEETLHRIADWALARHDSPKLAVKSAKRKLHQVYGAYFSQVNMATVEKNLEELSADKSDEVRQVCLNILQCHSSTKERIPVIKKVFSNIFNITG